MRNYCTWTKYGSFCFLEHYWKTAAEINFKIFVEVTIYEPIIMLMPFSWNVIRIRKLFVCLNAGCFYLFGKLIVLWISRFLLKQSSMSLYSCDPYCVLTSSEEGYVSLFNCWLILFVSKLFLTWNSKFLWKQTYIILQWDWCLLCDSGIKLVKFVFVSKLSLSLFKLLLTWIAKFLWKELSMSP